MKSFEDVLRGQTKMVRPERKRKTKKKVHVQEQKYALVPLWRRRRKPK